MSSSGHGQVNSTSHNTGSKKTNTGVRSASSTPPTGNQIPLTSGVVMAPQQQAPPSQSTSPPTVNNAPKYGTLVPNRVFVGGISANTTEVELAQLFSAYGTVKATKIISDRAGVSKGYGFVTFESEEEAKRLQREADNIMLRERRLNIAPAIKKQPFNRGFEVSSPPPPAAGQSQFYYAAAAAAAGGVPYAAYQNGMAYYTPGPPPTQTTGASGELSTGQPLYQAPPVYATTTAAPPAASYPMPMYPPQPLFVQHQYPYQAIPSSSTQDSGGGDKSSSTRDQRSSGSEQHDVTYVPASNSEPRPRVAASSSEEPRPSASDIIPFDALPYLGDEVAGRTDHTRGRDDSPLSFKFPAVNSAVPRDGHVLINECVARTQKLTASSTGSPTAARGSWRARGSG